MFSPLISGVMGRVGRGTFVCIGGGPPLAGPMGLGWGCSAGGLLDGGALGTEPVLGTEPGAIAPREIPGREGWPGNGMSGTPVCYSDQSGLLYPV